MIKTEVLVHCSLFISENIVNEIKPWMYYSLVTGLDKTRSGEEVQEICDIYFHNLELRFSDWKSIDVFVGDILFQKL